ncbi:serine/threonine-protein kinase [Anaerotaenia torta]|uniref:phosphotransferase family protein n=1 Tax=Anaerotaenia torta TaxID=433293 RepID=UPI003D22031C
MIDIPGYAGFIKIKEITKGMSGDKKYYIETADGKRLLLRIADITNNMCYDNKKAEFETVGCAAALGIPMPQPVYFGTSEDGKSVYTLLTWADGDEVKELLPALSDEEQYALGVKSGEVLRKIHAMPAPEAAGDWAERYFAVIDKRLEAFRTEGAAFEGNEKILQYLETNRSLLKGRPQCCHHGDYHEGNLILSEDGKLSVIDWHKVDFDNYGDPWYEFNRIACAFPLFASGQIDGYFSGDPPEEFWSLFAYYLAASAITSITWAKYFSPEELDSILQWNADILRWFDGMDNPVPSWYRKGSLVQTNSEGRHEYYEADKKNHG